MDLIKIYGKYKNAIKEKYDNNTKRMKYSCFCKDFPDLIETYNTLHKDFRFKDILYCIINDIDSIPKCAVCDNYVEIKNFNVGFRKCCSVDCRQKYEKTEDYSRHISNINKEVCKKHEHKYDYLFDGYDYEYCYKHVLLDGTIDRVKYKIYNYCKHGDIDVYLDNAIVLNEKRTDHEGGYCLDCNKEIFETYNPTEEEQNKILLRYKDFYNKNHFAMNRDFWIRYYPKTFKVLILYYKRCCDKDFVISYENVERDYIKIIQETNYCIINDLEERPLCPYPGCSNHRTFYNIQEGYLSFCEEHKHQTHVSAQELQLYDYLKDIGLNPQRNNRDIIKGCELDFYFPDKNRAIEYNGVWFHSLNVKPEGYHNNKFLKCKDAGIGLLCIWEDMWKNRPLACEERIKRHCFEALGRIDVIQHKEIERDDFLNMFKTYSLDKFTSIKGQRFCVLNYNNSKMYINYDVENDIVKVRTMFSVGIYNDNWYCDVVIGWFKYYFSDYRCLVVEEDGDVFTPELLRRCGDDNYWIEPVIVKANKGERTEYNMGVDAEGCYTVEQTGRLFMSFCCDKNGASF